jgi:hypothetical protein
MDPDESLRLLRDALTRALTLQLPNGPLAGVVGDLVDSVQALDQWLTGGGFLPAAWAGQR